MVGDFVVFFADGYRVVIEAKNQAEIGLGGKDGILAEADREWPIAGPMPRCAFPAATPSPPRWVDSGVYGARVMRSMTATV